MKGTKPSNAKCKKPPKRGANAKSSEHNCLEEELGKKESRRAQKGPSNPTENVAGLGEHNPESSPDNTEPRSGTKPQKRKSPDSTSDENPSVGGTANPDVTKKRRGKKSGPSMIDMMAKNESATSDDGVPSPEEEAMDNPIAKQPENLYESLHSILVAYKTGKVNPKAPKSPLTFAICADLCEDEVKAAKEWNKATKKRLHPAIISVLRIVFPDKRPDWFHKSFLRVPDGAARYWTKVLERRADLWRAAEAKEAEARGREKSHSRAPPNHTERKDSRKNRNQEKQPNARKRFQKA